MPREPESRPPPSGEDEQALWRAVTHDTVPLKGRKRPLPRPAAAGTTVAEPRAPPPPGRPPPPSLPPPGPPPLDHGRAPGLDKRTAERLKRGQLAIEARIDLHGLTQADAHRALTAFIDGAHKAGRRCVLVITGKGLGAEKIGVLRGAVPRWLNQPSLRPKLLAFCHAQPKHGGDGALYVLLKRRR
jgi:DNA-nicking Smr family endonuclease